MATGLDVGVIGLGVMGGNLARNFASRGFAVGGYDLDVEAARALATAHPEARLVIADSLASFVASLERPRRIVLLVNAGRPVDAVLAGLEPLLADGDIVVDGGNSLYTDTDRRLSGLANKGFRFVGMGVSGGAEGALVGPSLMPGGERDAWERLRPVLEPIAAKGPYGACVTYCGAGSAGHFVKMVHNGIEYGDMQLIAEIAVLLREGLGRSADEAAAAFEHWNAGELESFLVEVTAKVLRARDPHDASRPLVDAILDRAGQKGTGKWTVLVATELGVAIPTIAAAVDARIVSSQKAFRTRADAAFRPERGRLSGIGEDDLASALYAAKIASYAQGFTLLATASATFGYGTDLAEIARIWTAGCIIRARFLGRVRDAFTAGPSENLLLVPDFTAELAARLPALRKVVAAAASSGWPVPGLSASLGWIESVTQAHGSANVIQAQRDFFGRHGFERVDAPGTAVNADWDALISG